ncbi:MAG: Inosose isomerase [Chloroflexi bacterium ADurb.Bin325]|nr:MAG: Inosose isomerase [Chloroflexi bacterium ADurb.Bin325]
MFKSLSPGAIGVQADLATAVGLAAANGFDALHINLREAAALGAAQTRDLLARAGIRPGGFGFPLDYRRPEAEFDEALAELADLCAVAVAVGVTRTTTWIPSWHDSLDFVANHAFHVDRLSRAARILDAHGIRFGLEFLGPKTLRDGHPYAFIHTLEGMLALCNDIERAAGTRNMGLLLDAYHWYTARGVLREIEQLADADIVDVHVNDALPDIPLSELPDTHRALPGETGVIDLRGFLQALARLGYSGPVVVEPFSPRLKEMSPEDAVRATADALHRAWRDAGLAG